MAKDQDDEDYIVYGTPLEREEELGPRKRKEALDQGQARRVAPWNQEVTDSEGRRRFHGAFSGGFSAGYFNTVGSKEGWAPQSFKSSRKARAGKREQNAYDFMDEDEKAIEQEIDSKELGTSSEFDTFGSTAAELARRQAAQEIAKRPSAIPGPAIDEIVVPVTESIGVRLLLKMGWRHGRVIGPKHIAAAPDARREARKAMMALAADVASKKVYGADLPQGFQHESAQTSEENFPMEEDEAEIDVPSSIPIFVMNPKKDLHGLGFDPYKNAPEFRERKRARLEEEKNGDSHRGWKGQSEALKKPSLFRPNVGRMGSGFGIGALEDLGEEDEDVYSQGMEFEVQEVEEDDKVTVNVGRHPRALAAPNLNGETLPGFKLASESSSMKKQWFPPPVVPLDFIPFHKFASALQSKGSLLKPEPPDARPPLDPESRKTIEGLASFVAKSGQRFEDMSREKHIGNPAFAFLFGGEGHDYYVRRLWEEEKNLAADGKKQLEVVSRKVDRSRQELNAERRGHLLGETPLVRENVPVASLIAPEDRARLQSALSSTFTKSASVTMEVNGATPQFFKNDPAKQARFEQFMKDKFSGGLRKQLGGSSGLSEIQAAHEMMEFESVSTKFLEGPTSSKKTASQSTAGQIMPELATMMGNRFTTGGVEDTSLMEVSHLNKELILREETIKYPRRIENPWRPSSMLCKRFNLLDPYAGKPPPLPKPRSRTESFVLGSSLIDKVTEISLPDPSETGIDGSTSLGSKVLAIQDKMPEPPAATKNEEKVDMIVEKPVDLYKAIFSDDSEDDSMEEPSQEVQISATISGSSKIDPAQAATTALNRLVAGDFLESLGKELGLKVPEPRLIAADKSTASRSGEDSNLKSRRGLDSPMDNKGSLREEYGGMKARAKVFIHKAAIPTPREVKVPNEQDLIREQDASLATANSRYASKLNEKDSRWGDEDRDKTNALRFEGHTSDEAPTAKQKSYHKGTSAEFNTDDNRTQASCQEERRSKRERKEKRRHKHRRKHSVDEAKKRMKSQDKEGHHRHKRRRHSPASSSATSSSS